MVLNEPNLLYRLPPHLKNIPEFKTWNEVSSYELGLSTGQEEDILNQCFIDTATWGLIFWEKVLGISTDLNKSYEGRREIIKSKLRGQGTVTVGLIKNVAESYNNGEVEVIEDTPNYSFTIKFIAHDGIPQNLTNLKAAIEEIKPAHLNVLYDFKYLIWDVLDAKNLTWDELDALNLTWDIFETGIW